MRNPAELVDHRFLHLVKNHNLPKLPSNLELEDAGLRPEELIDLFESQVISRHLDLVSRKLRARGESYYTIGSSGHEGNAGYAKVFRHTDMAFLHYRSGAFFVQRAKKLPGQTPVYDLLLSFAASKEDPISSGRHKVFGSVPLFIPPQTSTIASHLPKAVGTAFSLWLAKENKIASKLPRDSIVLCSFGDASANHSTALGAMNTAEWMAYRGLPLPLVFVCEDNGIGISVPTPPGWIENEFSKRKFTRYFRCNGLDLLDVVRVSRDVEAYVRREKRPAFLHVKTVRLMAHAGSDVEDHYRSEQEIERDENQDPLLFSARILIDHGVMEAQDILDLYEGVRSRIEKVAEVAIKRPKLTTSVEIQSSIIPKSSGLGALPEKSDDTARKEIFGADWKVVEKRVPVTLAKSINLALTDILKRFPHTVVFGEDVGKKGGVYTVTTGLQKKFGPKRVFDSILDEQSILGNAIGLGHNGFVPIPEIQYLAYLHNAEDQLRGEAATLSYFSSGQYTNPMVIRIGSLAYQKGFGGHFHNDNSFTVLRDIPGIIVACPSSAADAPKLLRTCLEEAHLHGKIAVFLEPIALYFIKDLVQNGDNAWSFAYTDPDDKIPLGEFSVEGESSELTIISYGNGYYLSKQAAHDLNSTHRLLTKLIDLRWLSNISYDRLFEEVKNSKNILIVDECRKTGSISEEIITNLVERGLRSQISRVNGEDCFIPLGQAWTYILPSRESIVEAALKLVGIEMKRGQGQ